MRVLDSLKDALRFTLDPTAIEYRSTRRALLRARALARPGRFLDLGCGEKPYRDLFSRHFTSYWGVDFPNSDRSKHRIDVHGSGLDCPFGDGTFDTVLLIQVLEHTPDPARLLSEVARVLNDEGVLVATIPFVFSLHSEPHDYFRFTCYGIRHLLRENFEILHLEAKTRFFATMAQMLILHLWNPVKGLRSRFLYALVGVPVLALVSLAQGIGLALELVTRDECFTTGYCVVARKRPGSAAATQ